MLFLPSFIQNSTKRQPLDFVEFGGGQQNESPAGYPVVVCVTDKATDDESLQVRQLISHCDELETFISDVILV